MTKLILVAIALMATTNTAFAAVERKSRDLKLPSQQMVEKQSITNPAAAGTADVLSANAGNTSAAAATVTTFLAQPDVPRNLVITPGGSTGDVAACNVVVTGTNIKGRVITETFAFAENASSATTGTKAFKTITSVAFPAACEDSPFLASWSVGYGEKLGVKQCMSAPGHIFFSTLDSGSGFAKEGTAPTMVSDADEVEKNTADFNGTMNGSNDFELFFMQNYCP